MKIIIDDKIPYIKGILEAHATVQYCKGNEITKDVVHDADALIIRTRTVCNKELLHGSKVRYIATATIGFDHIDTQYCKENKITWTNAPGCNSGSVEQYLASALLYLAQEFKFDLCDKTIGVVGVGSVGKKVAHFCTTIGMKVLLNDPPREREEKQGNFVSIERIQNEADIISLHAPLQMQGQDQTFHLVGLDFLNRCKKKPIIINTCRGEVVNNQELVQAHKQGQTTALVIDCWENEPTISDELLELCTLATPHIAGYSRDGKANGTSMSIQAISKFFNLGMDNFVCTTIEEAPNRVIKINGGNLSKQELIGQAVLSSYNIKRDSDKLKSSPTDFELQRGNYPIRREFNYHKIIAPKINNSLANVLATINFNVTEKEENKDE